MVRMKLHLLLAKHGLNQQELSYATGIRQGTISNYINQTFKHIVGSHIDILCEYFNCDVSDLIEYTKEPHKD
jgi:putative transcriptional regulator